MVALKSEDLTALTLRTDKRYDRTDSDDKMREHWSSGGLVVIHHNHPSGELLSHADWKVLSSTTQPVTEIFAHAIDGTMYYGAPINHEGLAQALLRCGNAEQASQTALIKALESEAQWQYYGQSDVGDAGLRKHAVSLALARIKVVTYDVQCGCTVGLLMSELAGPIEAAVDAAHAALNG